METVEALNMRLISHYGIAVDSGDPIWRIVWSEDQFEKRLTHYTDEGLELLVPEIRELPKYKQWIHNKYILERLVVVPPLSIQELTTRISYEPIHIYEDGGGNPLPPKWEVTKFVVDMVYAAQGKQSAAKYVEDTSPEAQAARIVELEKELFGNETETGDALAHKQAIVVPRNYES